MSVKNRTLQDLETFIYVDVEAILHRMIRQTTHHFNVHPIVTKLYSQCQTYRTEPGVQKYGKIPYLVLLRIPIPRGFGPVL